MREQDRAQPAAAVLQDVQQEGRGWGRGGVADADACWGRECKQGEQRGDFGKEMDGPSRTAREDNRPAIEEEKAWRESCACQTLLC